MNSRGCSPTTSPPSFKPTTFDAGQDCFELDLRKTGNSDYTIVLPSSNASVISMQLEYDKAGDIISPVRSGVGTPTTSSSDGEYSTKLQLPLDIAASSSAGSPDLESLAQNGNFSNGTSHHDGPLDSEIRDSFSSNVISSTEVETIKSQISETIVMNGLPAADKMCNGSPLIASRADFSQMPSSPQGLALEESKNGVKTSQVEAESRVNTIIVDNETKYVKPMEQQIQDGHMSSEKHVPDIDEPKHLINVNDTSTKTSTSVLSSVTTNEESEVTEDEVKPSTSYAVQVSEGELIDNGIEVERIKKTFPNATSPKAINSFELQDHHLPPDSEVTPNLNPQILQEVKANDSIGDHAKLSERDICLETHQIDVSETDLNDSFNTVMSEGDAEVVEKKSSLKTESDEINGALTMDNIDQTIDLVTQREKNIARARKEAEEAAARNNLSNISQIPFKKFRKQYAKMVQQQLEDQPEASTSAETDSLAIGLLPLEPLDTSITTEEGSTPLATPSETGSIASGPKSKPPRKRRERQAVSTFCAYEDRDKGKCKQRAILQYQYCIRHILNDPEAPYKQCQHQRRAKSKKDDAVQCTNAISRDQPEIYCTTHLIMKGLREPKKKKNRGGDDASTISVDGSESYNEPVMTNQSSNFVEELSMNSFNEDRDSPFEHSSFPPFEHQHSQNESDYSQQPFSQQLPSTSYYEGQLPGAYTPTAEMPSAAPPSQTFQLIQKPNGEQILIDEYGNPQLPGSYSIIQGPNGTLQATFMPQGETPQDTPGMGFMSKTPPSSAPPTFGDNAGHEFRRPSVPLPNQPHRYQSLDNTPQKSMEHSPFPPSTPSAIPSQQQQISSKHPQLSARLFQPSNPPPPSTPSTPFEQPQTPQTQFIVQQPQGFPGASFIPQLIPTGMPYNEVLIQQPDGSFIQAPQLIDSMEMPPPPLPPSRTDSQAIFAQNGIQATDLRTMVTFPNGETQILPLGTQIIQTENGTTAIIPPQMVPDTLVPMLQQQQLSMEPQPQEIPPHLQLVNPEDKVPYPFLPFERPPKHLKPDAIETDSEDEETKMQKDYAPKPKSAQRNDKMICLRQKRQRMRIGGSFRKIPVIDEMAKCLEDHDFDKTDLFPLGLEPSDDDESSDEDSLEFGPRWWPTDGKPRNTAIEVFLQRKILKNEKAKLRKNAKIMNPLVCAAKAFPNSAGAALRTRDHHKRGLSRPANKPFRERRCYHMSTQSETAGPSRRSTRCSKPCLPRANHCSDHILFNIDQKLYEYCKREGCSRPVLPSEGLFTDGLCRSHYEQQEAQKASQGQPQIQAHFVFPPGHPSSSRYHGYPPGPADVTHFDNASTTLSSATMVRTSAYAGGLPSGMEPGHSQLQSRLQPPAQSQSYHHAPNYPRPPSQMCYDEPSTSSVMYFDNYESHPDNDDGDVSLASVAKDLGINSDALNEVLAHVDDEPMDCGGGDDDMLDPDKDSLDLGHNWADVEQFLLSEGYHVENPDGDVSGIPSSGFGDDGFGISGPHAFGGVSSSAFDSLIYHDLH